LQSGSPQSSVSRPRAFGRRIGSAPGREAKDASLRPADRCDRAGGVLLFRHAGERRGRRLASDARRAARAHRAPEPAGTRRAGSDGSVGAATPRRRARASWDASRSTAHPIRMTGARPTCRSRARPRPSGSSRGDGLGVEPRAVIGVPVVALLLWYLWSRKVRDFFGARASEGVS
jgi:hypothetical protein